MQSLPIPGTQRHPASKLVVLGGNQMTTKIEKVIHSRMRSQEALSLMEWLESSHTPLPYPDSKTVGHIGVSNKSMPCNARMTPKPATQCAKQSQRASPSYVLATRRFCMIVRHFCHGRGGAVKHRSQYPRPGQFDRKSAFGQFRSFPIADERLLILKAVIQKSCGNRQAPTRSGLYQLQTYAL